MKKLVLAVAISLVAGVCSYAKPYIATDDVKNQIGPAYAESMVQKIESNIKNNNYSQAKQQLAEISQWVSDATEYHTDLFKTLKKLDKADAQANIERDLAIKFATMRDKILFLQAQVQVHNGDKKTAVDNLVEVVKSQPSSDLGFKAYNLIKTIGFSYGVEAVPVSTDTVKPLPQDTQQY